MGTFFSLSQLFKISGHSETSATVQCAVLLQLKAKAVLLQYEIQCEHSAALGVHLLIHTGISIFYFFLMRNQFLNYV